MSAAGLPTIWELVEEAATTLPEPFTRAALINWVSARRPDVGVASIAAHIQFATDNAPSAANPFAGRAPLLHRVDRGLYLRYRPAPEHARVPPPVPIAGRVLLLGSSGAVAEAPAPAADLFVSPGFTRARDHALRAGLPWFVLSARHGLLDPGEVVSPFDLQFGDRSAAYRAAWGEWVVAQLAERLRLTGATVEVHGGVDFAQPLRAPLARRGAALELPLPGSWQQPDAADHSGEPPGGPEGAARESPARAALDRLRGLVSRHRADGPDRAGENARPDASAS